MSVFHLFTYHVFLFLSETLFSSTASREKAKLNVHVPSVYILLKLYKVLHCKILK